MGLIHQLSESSWCSGLANFLAGMDWPSHLDSWKDHCRGLPILTHMPLSSLRTLCRAKSTTCGMEFRSAWLARTSSLHRSRKWTQPLGSQSVASSMQELQAWRIPPLGLCASQHCWLQWVFAELSGHITLQFLVAPQQTQHWLLQVHRYSRSDSCYQRRELLKETHQCWLAQQIIRWEILAESECLL